MDKIETGNHRMIKLAAVLAVSVGWLAFQLWLWIFSADYLIVTAYYFGISPQFALESNPECLRLTSVLGYFTTLLPVLAGYYLTVMRPRRFSETPYWNKKRASTAAAIVTMLLIFSLFTIPKFYFAFFSGWEVSESTASKVFRLIVWINVALGIAGSILVACLAYIPSIAKCRPFHFPAIRHSVARYAYCILLGLLSAVGYVFVLNILGTFNEEAVQAVIQAFSIDPNLVSGCIVMAIMAPFVEELAFRGLIFNNLKKYMPTWLAVGISSFFFGFWHNNLGQLCACFCDGILFACVYQKTNRLRYAMLVHSVSNFSQCLSLASGTGLLPYIPFFHKLKDWLLGLPMSVSIASLVLVIAMIVVIVRKLLTTVDNSSSIVLLRNKD